MTAAILAFGQSNMQGAYGPSPSAGIYSPPIHAWKHSTNAFAASVLGADPFAAGGNNLAFVFQKELARHTEDENHLTLIAAGGMKLEHFMPAYVLTANGWTNTQSSVFGASAADELLGAPPKAARQALQVLGKSQYDIVLGHIGEANTVAGDSAATQQAKFEALFQDMDLRDMIDLGTTPIILGHINPAYSGSANHAAAIEAFAAAHAMVATVPWDGIETVGGGNAHANGVGLEQLGVRYFDAYRGLLI